MKRMVALLVLITACTEAKCDPPANPLEIATEIGSVASERGKVKVKAAAVVTKNHVKMIAVLYPDDNSLNQPLALDEADLKGVEDSLKDIIASPDKDYAKKVGESTVSSREEDGKRVVTVAGGSGFLQTRLTLDLDNTESLVKLLKKTRGVHEWMKEKLPALQK